MTLYKDKNFTGGYRYTCCLRIDLIKYLSVNLSKIDVSRLIHATYLYLFKLCIWKVTQLYS